MQGGTVQVVKHHRTTYYLSENKIIIEKFGLKYQIIPTRNRSHEDKERLEMLIFLISTGELKDLSDVITEMGGNCKLIAANVLP